MSTAGSGGTSGTSGGSGNYELDPDSLDQAITKLTQLEQRVTQLKSDFAGFTGGVSASDWSSEPSCLSFGQSYTSALSVYSQVITGMETDVGRYRDSLKSALASYRASDTNALDRFVTAIGVLDENSANNSGGQAQYHAPVDRGGLSSDDPERAPDTSPGQPGDGPDNGSGPGSQNGGPQNGGTATAGNGSPPSGQR